MDTVALSMFAELAAMPTPNQESAPARDLSFGALVAAIAKKSSEADAATDVQTNEIAHQPLSITDPTPTDNLSPRVDAAGVLPPPFIVRQWLAQSEAPLPPKLLHQIEKVRATEHDVIENEAISLPTPSDVPSDQQNPPPLSQSEPSALVANQDASASAGQEAPATADASPIIQIDASSQPDGIAPRDLTEFGAAIPPLPGVPRPQTAEYRNVSIETREYAPLSLASFGTALAQRSAAPPLAANSAAITGTAVDSVDSESADSIDSVLPIAHVNGKTTVQTSEAAQAAQMPEIHRAFVPPVDPSLQVATTSQGNTPQVSEGFVTLSQPVNLPASANTAVESPLKFALATRDVQAQVETLALHIAARSARGDSRFTIRLDPPELGRIEVSLSVTHHGHAQAVLAVDKPQTLDLLQRDAAALERALKDAGLELGGNLSFSLKEDSRPHAARDDHYPLPNQSLELVQTDAPNAQSALNATLLEQLYGLRIARLDITV